MTISKFKYSYFFLFMVCLALSNIRCSLQRVDPVTDPTNTLTADFSSEFTPSDFAPCTVDFKELADNETTYEWFVNDISKSNNPTFLYKFDLPGTYNVKLAVTNLPLKKDTASKTKSITVRLKTFEKTLSAFGTGKKIVALKSGEFLVAGVQLQSGSATFTDGYVIKINANGDIVQSFQTVKLDMSNADDISDLVAFSDGSFGIFGSTYSADGTHQDMLYACISETGSWIISPTRLGIAGIHEVALCGAETSNPNKRFVAAGRRTPTSSSVANAYLISRGLNPTFDYGSPIYTSTNYEQLNDITTTGTTGNFMATGITRLPSGTLTDVLLLQTDNAGNVVAGFPKTLGIPANSEDARSIIRISTGKYLIAGFSRALGTAAGDFWLYFTDINGTLSSPIVFGDATLHEEARDVVELLDGSFALAGRQGNNAVLAKTNAAGVFQAPYKTYMGTAFSALAKTNDGGLIFVGNNGTSLYVVKTNANGDF
jgi:PKD repeat protein